jgi:hypothetical protein
MGGETIEKGNVMATNKNVLGSGLEILKTSKAWSSKIEVM